jgi:hypothetical protein
VIQFTHFIVVRKILARVPVVTQKKKYIMPQVLAKDCLHIQNFSVL